MTKEQIRERVWARLRAAGVVRFPSATTRVPNFAGAEQAATLLRQLTIWKRARTVKLTPDAPQLALRRAALREGKTVYLAVPRLRAEKCFVEVDPRRLHSGTLMRVASIRAAMALGRLVAPHEMQPVDLIVTGAVGVTRRGSRVGSGGGFADLEYALLRREGKVREYTPILTTIHPLQIIAERIPMRSHDTPVDFLITPHQVIAAPSLYPRPRGILWNFLGDEKIRAIPALRRSHRQTSLGTPGQV